MTLKTTYCLASTQSSEEGQISSTILPLRQALLDKCRDTFLGVARHHVLNHDFGGIVVSPRKFHFELTVECPLADRHDMLRLCGNLVGKRHGLRALRPGRHNPVDKAY